MTAGDIPIRRHALKAVAYRTAAVAIFVAAALLCLRSSALLIPSVAGAAFLYAASVVKAVLAGKLSVPLYNSLLVLAVSAAGSTLVMSPLMRAEVRGLGLSVLLLGTALAIHIVSRAHSDLTSIATRALLIASIGYLYYSLLSGSGVYFLPQLAFVVLIGFAAAAAFSFASILGGHSDARLSSIGKTLTGIWSPMLAGSAVAVVLTYLAFIRPSLLRFGAVPVTVIEWAVLCAIAYLLFRKIRSILPGDTGPEFGYGHRVAGMLRYDKGELETASSKVEEFVATGKKDGLVAMAAAALLKNGVPAEAVQGVIAIIVNYAEEPEPPAMFRWARGDLDLAKRRSRARAVKEMTAAAAAAAGAGDAEPAKTRRAAVVNEKWS